MNLTDIDAVWDYEDPAGSEVRFRAILPHAEEAGSAGYRVELHSQLARAVCLQRRFAEAHAILDAAVPGKGETGRPRIRWLLERGRIHNDTGQTDDAMGAFEEAWRLAELAEETSLAADALHMIAYVAEGEESVRWHGLAIDFCRRHEDERLRRWLCTLHMNLGGALESLGEYGRARASVEDARALAADLGIADHETRARIFTARLHRLEGDVQRAWAILGEVFDPETTNGYAFEEMAECLAARGQGDEARPYFRGAYERLVANPWFPPRETERLERMRQLGHAGDSGP
jgi:tetratricopeptide (TPR) repeat protein